MSKRASEMRSSQASEQCHPCERDCREEEEKTCEKSSQHPVGRSRGSAMAPRTLVEAHKVCNVSPWENPRPCFQPRLITFCVQWGWCEARNVCGVVCAWQGKRSPITTHGKETVFHCVASLSVVCVCVCIEGFTLVSVSNVQSQYSHCASFTTLLYQNAACCSD